MMTSRCYRTYLLFTLLLPIASTQNLTDAQLALVNARLADSAKTSWELGTRAQAILSQNATPYSVLTPKTPLPPPPTIPSPALSQALDPFFAIARNTVANRRLSNGENVTGPQPLIQDGSAADPASIGFAVLLANWTGQQQQGGGGDVPLDYAGAAKDQLDFLLLKVPRTSDGAISHRVSEVQLWSDFIYMVPPFLAYYGVITQNRSLLIQAHDQIKLYRSHLRDPTANGLWKHVLLGTSGNDEGHWSTGNAWAAAGILRVLSTLQNSAYANTLKHEQNNLASWISEIHNGMYPHLDAATSNLFPNYASQPASAPGNFLDAAATALLASTVYRFALVWGVYRHLPVAERTRRALCSSSSSSSSSPSENSAANASALAHFDANGWLTPVVDPHSYGREGRESPEAQAFVVEMQAAWRDWVADGSKGANGALRTRKGAGWVGKVVVVVVAGAFGSVLV